jgi:hypothetical protein
METPNYDPDIPYLVRMIKRSSTLDEALKGASEFKMDFEVFSLIAQKFPEILQHIEDDDLRVQVARSTKAISKYTHVRNDCRY